MKLVSALLATFALGLIVTGVVLGLLPAGGGGCGAAFSSGQAYTDVCSEPRADRRVMPVALIGLGITAGVAAVVAHEAGESERIKSRSSV